MIKLLDGHKYSEVFKDLVFFIDTAKGIFKQASPYKFMMYGGNCCRQSAFLSHMYLSKYIPEYKWEIYESKFTSDAGDFEHSWCFGHKENEEEGIFVDLAYSNGAMNNFLFEGSNNFPGYISKIDAGCMESKTNRISIPSSNYINLPEFYTGMNGYELFDFITNISVLRKEHLEK